MVPAGAATSAERAPRAGALSCLERCADARAAAVGGRIAISGGHLGGVSDDRFPRPVGNRAGEPGGGPRPPSRGGRAQARAERSAQGRRREGAPGSHREAASDRGGAAPAPARRLRPARRPGAAPSRVRRRTTPGDARVSLPRAGLGRCPGEAGAQRQRQADLEPSRSKLPYKVHRLRWNGILPGQGAAPPGHYRFKVQRAGPPRPPLSAISASTTASSRSGAAWLRRCRRSGSARPDRRQGAPGAGRFRLLRHQVIAARGGRVQARGSDPVLYGNWVVIDARGTKTDYRYAHFLHPASVHDGERVQDRPTIGRSRQDGQRPNGRLPAPFRGLAAAAGSTAAPSTPCRSSSAGTAGANRPGGPWCHPLALATKSRVERVRPAAR